MVEEHVCIMLGEFKHIAEDMADRKNNERDMQKNISDIRTSQERVVYVTEQVQKTQELQAMTAKENQVEVARTNKEYKTTMDAGFKAIEDRRIADEKAALLEKKEADKEKLRLKELQDAKDEAAQELQDAKDEAARLEKKADRKAKATQTWGLYLIGAGILGNLVLGVLVKWAPTLIGLPAGK